MSDVEVDVRDQKVATGPAGGDRQARKGDKIKWKKQDAGKSFKFQLVFRKQNPADTGPDWPFRESDDPPGSNATGLVHNFNGTIDVEAGDFKYDIESDDGSTTLDPRIIVGRI